MSAPPDPVRRHRDSASGVLGYAAVTVSDTRSATDDVSGRRIEELVGGAGHRLEERVLVPDHPAEIRAAVQGLLSRPEVDVVVLTGGTGFAPRDVTLEAVAPLFERTVEGFGELFRVLSFEQVGAAAMLSRATAGTVGRRLVFVLPGSPKAVELAMERLILPEAGHLVGQLTRRPEPPV